MRRYISIFISVVVITHLAALFFFGMLWYFSGLDQALTNVSGWHEIHSNGVVHFHRFNLLHYLALTYFPAIIIAPFVRLLEWAYTPRNFKTALGKPLRDIKL